MRGPGIAAWQDDRKWEIARAHALGNPVYRALVGSQLPSRWEELPVVTKAAFQRPLAETLSEGLLRNRLHISSTSGSSGHPFFFAKDRYTHARTWALLRQRYSWQGIRLDSLQARFYGIPLERWARWKEVAKDRVMRRVRFPVFDLSETTLEDYRRRFSRKPFEFIYGYANSLAAFAKHVLSRNAVLSEACPSLKACITTSEMCGPEDRLLLEAAFGVPVVDEYGSSETGIISFEHPASGWRISWENLYVEAVDEWGRPVAPGETGQLLVTDLFNAAMPFVRYAIGDIGSLGVGADGFPVLRSLDGRRNDTILLPSGRRAAGLTFYYISRSILERAGVMREFVIRQTALDAFEFDVVSDTPLSGADVRSIEEKMELYLEPGLTLRINRVPAIARPASGKRKHFFSELRDHAAS